MNNPIISFALRGTQALFGIIVIGLSVGLMKGQKIDSPPTTFSYSIFVGAVTLVGAFVGIAGNFVELLQGIIGAAIDGVVLLANIAGGIIIAYKLRGLNCNDKGLESLSKMFDNNLLNGGCVTVENIHGCAYDVFTSGNKLSGRCQQSQADSVFMFLTVVTLLACLTMTFLHLKK